MDMEKNLSSTKPDGLADEATAATEAVSEKKELPLRLYFGYGPRIHKKLSIELGVTDKRCKDCGEVGQLTCFSTVFRKWALRRVTQLELSQTCRICNERGHNYLNCDLYDELAEVPAPKEKRRVHCGLCGGAGHNQRTCQKLVKHN